MHPRICHLHPFKYVTADPKCQDSCRLCENRCPSHQSQSHHRSFEIDSLIINVHQQREKFQTMPSQYMKIIQKKTDAQIKRLQDSKKKYIERIKKVTEFYRQRAKAREKKYPNLDEKLSMLERKRIDQLTCCDIDIILKCINNEELEDQLALIFKQFKKEKFFNSFKSTDQQELRQKHYKEISDELTKSFTDQLKMFKKEYQKEYRDLQDKNVELEQKIREKTRRCNELQAYFDIMKRKEEEASKKKSKKKPKQRKLAPTKLKENTRRLITNHIKAQSFNSQSMPEHQKYSQKSAQQEVHQKSMPDSKQVQEKAYQKFVQGKVHLKSGQEKINQKSFEEKFHQKFGQDKVKLKSEEKAQQQDRTPPKTKLEVFEYNPSIQREKKIKDRQISHHTSPPVLKISRDVEFIQAKHQNSPLREQKNHQHPQSSFNNISEQINPKPIKIFEEFIPGKSQQNLKVLNSPNLTPGIQYNLNTENSNPIIPQDKHYEPLKKVEVPNGGLPLKFPIKSNEDELGFSDESQEFKDFPEDKNRKDLWQSEMPDQFYVKNFKK